MIDTVIQFAAANPVLIGGMLVAGLVSGFAGGLFGIGGGIVTVPALYAVFVALGVDDGLSLKTAVGTSLGVIIVTSLRSLATHHRAGHVDFDILIGWGPWIALGSAAGGAVAHWVPSQLLALVFVGGAVFIAFRRIRGGRKTAPHRDLHQHHVKIPIGVGTGVFSSLMGLGGGALGVMVMTASGRAIHQAVATSAGFGVAVAVPGAAGFIWSGHLATGLPAGSLGYFNIPAFILMAITAAIAAPLGARLAHRTKGELLSKLFGLYVLLAAGALAIDIFFH